MGLIDGVLLEPFPCWPWLLKLSRVTVLDVTAVLTRAVDSATPPGSATQPIAPPITVATATARRAIELNTLQSKSRNIVRFMVPIKSIVSRSEEHTSEL